MKYTIEQAAERFQGSPKLFRAVLRQADGRENMEDVANHGADAGFHGFIYYGETCVFYARNQVDIVALAESMADEFGQSAVEMVQGFGCLGPDFSLNEIGRVLYGPPEADEINISNALAWFALEEVARCFVE